MVFLRIDNNWDYRKFSARKFCHAKYFEIFKDRQETSTLESFIGPNILEKKDITTDKNFFKNFQKNSA